GADLDRLRVAGYCTIVVVPEFGPPFESQPNDVRTPVQGDFWTQMGTVLDEASTRDMHIWFESFQKADAENAVLRSHPECAGEMARESGGGKSSRVPRAAHPHPPPAATDAYIAVLHAEFERRFPGRFGTTLVGFWDDESKFSTAATSQNLPWSVALPAEFEA